MRSTLRRGDQRGKGGSETELGLGDRGRVESGAPSPSPVRGRRRSLFASRLSATALRKEEREREERNGFRVLAERRSAGFVSARQADGRRIGSNGAEAMDRRLA